MSEPLAADQGCRCPAFVNPALGLNGGEDKRLDRQRAGVAALEVPEPCDRVQRLPDLDRPASLLLNEVDEQRLVDRCPPMLERELSGDIRDLDAQRDGDIRLRLVEPGGLGRATIRLLPRCLRADLRAVMCCLRARC